MGPRVAPIVLVLAAASFFSCVQVDGGAVEIAWVISVGEKRESCETAGVRTVRLSIEGAKKAFSRHEDFDCEDGYGATDFDLPEGDYSFRLEVLDDHHEVLTPSDGLCVPPPQIRSVVEGHITDLEVWLIRRLEDAAPSC